MREEAAALLCQFVSLFCRGMITGFTEAEQPEALLHQGCPLCHVIRELLGVCLCYALSLGGSMDSPISPQLLQLLLYCLGLFSFSDIHIGFG